jgi:hypothetical protein
MRLGAMEIKRWDKKLSEFLDLLDGDIVRVDRRYQRSGRVWPLNAKSYLVETVILNFALPRLMLHEVPSKRGRPGYQDIIDGQQRTATFREFRADGFALSSKVDRRGLRGKKYSTLTAKDRNAFDSYVLKIDRFVDATDADIREVFRRIKSYTVPLNPEEQRHAKFQGEFKWFIYRHIEKFSPILQSSGVLSRKQIDRMADAKLLAEIVHALVNGISTTNATILQRIYSDFDREFALDREITRKLDAARKTFKELGALPKAIAKHFHAYSLLLALVHAQGPISKLSALTPRRREIKSIETIKNNLSTLAAVLDLDEDEVLSPYEKFYEASVEGTNVKLARETRFKWYYDALTAASI